MSFSVKNDNGTLKRVTAKYNDNGVLKSPKDMQIYYNDNGTLHKFPQADQLQVNLTPLSWVNLDKSDAFTWMDTPAEFDFPYSSKTINNKTPNYDDNECGIIPGYAYLQNRRNPNEAVHAIKIGCPINTFDYRNRQSSGGFTFCMMMKWGGNGPRWENYMGTNIVRLIQFDGADWSFFLNANDKKVYWDRGYNGGSTAYHVPVFQFPSENTWVHMVFSVFCINNSYRVRCLVNGQPAFSNGQAEYKTGDGGYDYVKCYPRDKSSIWFGASWGTGVVRWTGYQTFFRTFRSWKVPLTVDEMKAVYAFDKI